LGQKVVRVSVPVASVSLQLNSGHPTATMLGFGSIRALFSSTAPTTSAVPEVTSEVTADAHSTDVVTSEVTSEVTAPIEPTVSSSRIVTKWTETKPFPERESGPVQVWPVNAMPVRFPTAEQIAKELFAAMQRQSICAGQWLLAQCIEDVVYPRVCLELGWPPRPWLGRGGVARHLAKLSPRAPKYMWVEVNGEKHNLLHYFIPRPAAAVALSEEMLKRA
jgi:hypothetical protein